MAIEEGGCLWTWGQNVFGQLGDGATTNCLTPIKLFFEITNQNELIYVIVGERRL